MQANAEMQKEYCNKYFVKVSSPKSSLDVLMQEQITAAIYCTVYPLNVWTSHLMAFNGCSGPQKPFNTSSLAFAYRLS